MERCQDLGGVIGRAEGAGQFHGLAALGDTGLECAGVDAQGLGEQGVGMGWVHWLVPLVVGFCVWTQNAVGFG